MATMNLRSKSQRGSNSVEFALAVPVLALMIFGSVDFCRAMWTNNTIAQAALDGARYASVRSVDSDDPTTAGKVRAAVVESAVGLDEAKVGVTTSWPSGNNEGAIVTVTVTYDFELITPLLPIRSIALDFEAQLPIVN
jgi:Flp pilus assembly protein TadG